VSAILDSALARLSDGYDPEGDVDLGGYGGSMAVYASLVASSLLVGAGQHRSLPDRYDARDLVIGGIATHKLSRLLSKGGVTSPLRAPFTEFTEAGGASEHVESPRGHGARHAIGSLVTCPFCVAVWIATAYVGGLAVAPRQARACAALFAVVAGSDFLQHVYARVRSD
jgi:hypothetical protein